MKKNVILIGIATALLALSILVTNYTIDNLENRIDKLEKILFEIEKNGISLN